MDTRLDTRMVAVVKGARDRGPSVRDDIEVPHARAGHIRVAVAATGICGTDVHIAADEYASDPPVVMGHEITGVVDEVGPGAPGELLGARVSLETYASVCGTCLECRTGRPNLCRLRRSLGSFENGGFAPYVVAPWINAHRLPDELPVMSGVLCEPLACVTQCLFDPAKISAGDRVLVTGPGAMGQLAARVAILCGGRVTVAGLDSDRARLDLAAAKGAQVTVDQPAGEQFDVVIECSGSGPAMAGALRAVRRGGRYVQVGIAGHPVSWDMDAVLYKEVRISSGFASTPASWRRAIGLLTDHPALFDDLVTAEYPLTEWDEALRTVRAGTGIKTVIVPDGRIAGKA